MNRWRKIMSRPAFSVLVFLICLVLFNWPYLSPAEDWPPQHVFVHIFLAWALVILILFLSYLSQPSSGSEQDDSRDPSDL